MTHKHYKNKREGITMIKATDARTYTDNARAEAERNKTKRAQEFCDDVISEQVKVESDKGNDTTTICNTFTDIDVNEVIAICKDAGYKVTRLNANTFVLIW